MTLMEILNKLNVGKRKNEWDNSYHIDIYNDSRATRKQISEYLKKCHDENHMSWELIDAILDNKVGCFFHYNGYSIHPVCSEFDYIAIDKGGRIFIWCEVDGFHAYLDEYKKQWFTSKEYELLKPFLKEFK